MTLSKINLEPHWKDSYLQVPIPLIVNSKRALIYFLLVIDLIFFRIALDLQEKKKKEQIVWRVLLHLFSTHVISFFFGHSPSTWKFPGRGSNPARAVYSHCSDNVRSLTRSRTRELHNISVTSYICYIEWTNMDTLFFGLFVFCFLGPHLQHMEIRRLGVEAELQLLAYTTAHSKAHP